MAYTLPHSDRGDHPLSQKRKTPEDPHERGANACSDKSKPSSIEDSELEEREDRDRSEAGHLEEIVSDECPADADQSETRFCLGCKTDTVDADQQVRDLDGVGIDSCESRDLSAYLLACHWDSISSSRRRYSVFKMVASSASDASRKRLKHLGSLKTDAHGKVFTSVSSRNRAWIVCVGGDHRDTIIFDTTSSNDKKKKVIQGPKLNSAKWSPVLRTLGDKVYAMSKTPSWVSDRDFPPWFEVLDLSKARVVTVAGKLHLEDCSWTPLPHPPCMPWELSPRGYIRLTIVILNSCVVVGPYILVSFNTQWGSYALDTNAQEPYQWHKVHKHNLPFVGCATPLGSIFVAPSREGHINAYRIHVATSSDDHKDTALKLSFTVLPVKHIRREVDVGPCFSSLDSESFCSVRLSVDKNSLVRNRETGELFPQKVHVNLTTYQIENPLLLENNRDETMLAVNPEEVAVSSQQERTLSIANSTHGLSPAGFSLVPM